MGRIIHSRGVGLLASSVLLHGFSGAHPTNECVINYPRVVVSGAETSTRWLVGYSGVQQKTGEPCVCEVAASEDVYMALMDAMAGNSKSD